MCVKSQFVSYFKSPGSFFNVQTPKLCQLLPRFRGFKFEFGFFPTAHLGQAEAVEEAASEVPETGEGDEGLACRKMWRSIEKKALKCIKKMRKEGSTVYLFLVQPGYF